MNDVQETLYTLVPEPATMSNWDAVLGEARPRRRSPVLQLAVATGIACLAALFVVAPWKVSERAGILDRALAAVGDGPVLHLVLRGDWGGTQIDLETGKRKPVYGEREVWFDPARDLVHQVSRYGGVVDHAELYKRDKQDRELTALWQDYRGALEQGTARVIGQDVVSDVPVYWLIVRSKMRRDGAGGENHEFAQQVAISRKTFKPIAMRYTRDRQAPPGSTEHVLRFETISLEEADFSSPPERSIEGPTMEGSDPIDISQAANVLGAVPYWLGPEFAGISLGQAQKSFSAAGIRERTLVTGARATEIRECLRMRTALRPCGRDLSRFEVRGDDVYELGPLHFGVQKTGLALFYGEVGDNPTTFEKPTKQNIVLVEKTDPDLRLLGLPPMAYLPPEGSVVLMPGATGYLVRNGVYISIRAASGELILGAAQALRPMPSAGSAAGG
jgi:hypothetical protein